MLTTIADSAILPGVAELIGTSEAAKRCGVDRTTFFRWMQLGRIHPAGRLSESRTGAHLFDAAEVAELAREDALRKKHGACPRCPWPTWHNGDPCPEQVAS